MKKTPKLISSNQNAWLKEVQLLIEKSKVRQTRGLFVVEGLFEIRTALRAGFSLLTLAKNDQGISWEDLMLQIGYTEGEAELLSLTDMPWEKIVTRKTGVNALGVFKRDDRFERPWHPVSTEIWLAVETVEKPGNLGAILRTADAAGIAGVLLVDGFIDVLHPHVIRNSLGAVCTVPLYSVTKEQLWETSLEKDLRLFSTFMEDSQSCYQANLGMGSVIIMGAEHQGVSDFWKGKVNNIQIPMEGHVDSLNVSVAAALLMYEAKRQQAGGSPA